MQSLLAAVEDAGIFGWAIVGLGGLGGLVSVGAAVAGALRARAVGKLALVARGLGGRGGGLGGGGAVRGRVLTDRSVVEDADELRPVERQRVRREGYLEARGAARIGLVCAALPLLAGVVAACAAARRKGGEGGGAGPVVAFAGRPGRGLQVGTALAAVASAGFALAALLEPVPGRNLFASQASREVLDHLEDIQHATESGIVLHACSRLEHALYEKQGTLDRGLVPGLPEAARRCVEERIQAAAVLSSISGVEEGLQDLAQSPFVKHDRRLARRVDDALEEVRKIAASPPPRAESDPPAVPLLR